LSEDPRSLSEDPRSLSEERSDESKRPAHEQRRPGGAEPPEARDDSADPTARVRAAASARGLDIELRRRPDAHSLAEAAALMGLQPADIVKTLVVKRHDGGYLYALIPGDRAISWPKLRTVVGVNRLRMPEPELALEATGYARGTIVPIGATNDWPVYADAEIVGRRIAMGAGARGYSLFVQADALIAAYQATVADISQPADA